MFLLHLAVVVFFSSSFFLGAAAAVSNNKGIIKSSWMLMFVADWKCLAYKWLGVLNEIMVGKLNEQVNEPCRRNLQQISGRPKNLNEWGKMCVYNINVPYCTMWEVGCIYKRLVVGLQSLLPATIRWEFFNFVISLATPRPVLARFFETHMKVRRLKTAHCPYI